MQRFASSEELAARLRHGDRSFLEWLRSGDRRRELLENQNSAGYRFVANYLRASLHEASGAVSILHIGCGIGTVARSVLQVSHGGLRYVGMDYDSECIRICQQTFGSISWLQFHPCDYLNFPVNRSQFDHVLLTGVLGALPGYQSLVSRAWSRCSGSLLILFDQPLRTDPDRTLISSGDRRLTTVYSREPFIRFAESLTGPAGRVSFRTVYSDTNEAAEHVALLQRDQESCGVEETHRYAEPGRTCPYSVPGLERTGD